MFKKNNKKSMLIKTDDGKLKDVAIEQVEPENYIVPEGEEELYHIKQEVVLFSQSTGRRMSRPRIQIYDARIWEQTMRRQLKLGGYTVTVLHDPTEAIKARKEREQKMREGLKPKNASARKREFEDAVQKAVAAELARLTKKTISKGKESNADQGTTTAE